MFDRVVDLFDRLSLDSNKCVIEVFEDFIDIVIEGGEDFGFEPFHGLLKSTECLRV